MPRKNKTCSSCGNYGAYYKKGYCHFFKQDCGFCTLHKEIVDKNYGCDKWKEDIIRRKLRKSTLMRALREILTDIAEIRQIIGEERHYEDFLTVNEEDFLNNDKEK